MRVKLLKFTNDPEKTCAAAARLCYSGAGIDEIEKKLTKEKIKGLLNQIISSGHHSVLEHVSFSFFADGVSRALLAQLTRHRIASFSVQSQRYVKYDDGLTFIVPASIKNNKKAFDKYKEFLNACNDLYKYFLNEEIPAEDARYILPNAAPTKIFFTMNARELRHFFSIRCCNRAQWEIKEMACAMLNLVKKKAPIIFFDAGPECLRTKCQESKSCGKPWKKRGL
ncbi:MAG: FAD-dependent thymidylate synthase [Elusimicrobiota bacterium]|jgi:thymidylate synthase (FAD)|nr:FAD-dependent thymidylate synthase [Elusimicrobiota bacterium]